MLFILNYFYNFYNYINNKLLNLLYFCYNNKDDELIPTRKEQEFINFNIYSKTIIIDNVNDNDNDN